MLHYKILFSSFNIYLYHGKLSKEGVAMSPVFLFEDSATSPSCKIEQHDDDIITCDLTRQLTYDPEELLRLMQEEGWDLHYDSEVVQRLTRVEQTGPLSITFFRAAGLKGDALPMEYEKYGLDPLDFMTLATVNKFCPGFVRRHANATQWLDIEAGALCHAAFTPGITRKGKIHVDNDMNTWSGNWWFGGICFM
jgi:hypothetical protein